MENSALLAFVVFPRDFVVSAPQFLVFGKVSWCLYQFQHGKTIYTIKSGVSGRIYGVDCPPVKSYTTIAFTPQQDRATQRCDLSGCGGLARERFFRSFSFCGLHGAAFPQTRQPLPWKTNAINLRGSGGLVPQ